MSRTAAAISVLLVEDEVMISNLVADRLSESGFRVHEVVTADEALRLIKSGANVDVLFTDINLPGGMNGAELAERVRELRPDLPPADTSTVRPAPPVCRSLRLPPSRTRRFVPLPMTTLSTPAGRPASSSSSAIFSRESGVFVAGFTTRAFPAAIAGATLCATRFIGKLNGVMAPMTPIGTRR